MRIEVTTHVGRLHQVTRVIRVNHGFGIIDVVMPVTNNARSDTDAATRTLRAEAFVSIPSSNYNWS